MSFAFWDILFLLWELFLHKYLTFNVITCLGSFQVGIFLRALELKVFVRVRQAYSSLFFVGMSVLKYCSWSNPSRYTQHVITCLGAVSIWNFSAGKSLYEILSGQAFSSRSGWCTARSDRSSSRWATWSWTSSSSSSSSWSSTSASPCARCTSTACTTRTGK